MQLLGEDPELLEKLGDVPVAVVEKGKVCGAHQLSGAIMRPDAMQTLWPDLPDDGWPNYGKVPGEAVYLMLNRKRSLRIPTPPPFKNHGNYIVSVSELTRWMAERAEEAGAYLLTETAAQKLLVDERAVVGVRTGDKGRERDGSPKPNFEPGTDLVGKFTVLADGVWGHLTGAAIKYLDLAPPSGDPQVWALGVKEVWEVPKKLEKVIHTLGWPLRTGKKYQEFGGSWIYPLGENKVSIGFVVGLNYSDTKLSAHDLLQEFKTHPRIHKILDGGKRIAWGAKAIPEGGYWAMPKLAGDRFVICGDAGGMVNVPELKGIHYGMLSGIMAAEEIYRALKEDRSRLAEYEQEIDSSVIGRDLYRTRNMKQPFERGFFRGGAITNMMVLTRGKFPGGHWKAHRDVETPLLVTDRDKRYPKPDGKYTFDKLSSVYLSGNSTRDDAPNHICIQQDVPRELAETWQWMCPAGVYEVPEDAPESGNVELTINPSNCVQCGAITAKGGRLTPPEGGDGPLYQIT
jgi:electron-transferring-flavoprotein dehydrogenase